MKRAYEIADICCPTFLGLTVAMAWTHHIVLCFVFMSCTIVAGAVLSTLADKFIKLTPVVLEEDREN